MGDFQSFSDCVLTVFGLFTFHRSGSLRSSGAVNIVDFVLKMFGFCTKDVRLILY